MKLSVSDAKNNFYKIVQDLIDGKEDTIVVTKNGKPVIQLVPISKKNSKRIGAAKKEMQGFEMSQEEFNSIPTLDFDM